MLCFLKFSFALLILVVVSLPMAHAEVAVDFKGDKNWNIYLGGFFAKTNTTLRVDSSNGRIGTTIKGEEDLAWSDRETSPLVGMSYRFHKNHKLMFSYWSIRRQGLNTLNTSIDVGDQTYNFGATVDSSFTTDIYRLTYEYNFYHSKDASLGFLAGLHITNLKFAIRTVGNSGATSETEANAVAPLPTLGLSWSYHLTDEWYTSAWFQGLALEYDKYKGKMLNAAVSATYKPFESVAFSAGLVSFDLNIISSDVNARGEFDYEYTGPFLSVHTMF